MEEREREKEKEEEKERERERERERKGCRHSHRHPAEYSGGCVSPGPGNRRGISGRRHGTSSPQRQTPGRVPWQRWPRRGGTAPTGCPGCSYPETQSPAWTKTTKQNIRAQIQQNPHQIYHNMILTVMPGEPTMNNEESTTHRDVYILNGKPIKDSSINQTYAMIS